MTPIAVFTYNRPEHTRRALTSLSRCARLDECPVYVYCDGARAPNHMARVDATRQTVRAWAAEHQATVVERPHNLGLARSIVTGVTDLCQHYGRVIVIEDDLVVSPDFVDYMLQALDRYAGCPVVYQVSGYMFPVEHPPTPDAFFLPLTTTWGWATWQRAWQHFDWTARGWEQRLSRPPVRLRFDLDGSYPYFAMLKQRLQGRNDSWGVLWWYAVFSAAGLVLHPRRSLVWNGGFDGSGTHCGDRDAVDTAGTPPETLGDPQLSAEITWPEHVAIDAGAFDTVKGCVRTTYRPGGRSVARISRGVRRRLGRALQRFQ